MFKHNTHTEATGKKQSESEGAEMGRLPSLNQGLTRGAWTAQEDKILADYIKAHGEGKWKKVPKQTGLKRCGKACRLRWMNYLRPDIKRGNITPDEQDLIIRLHKLLGNRWSLIAARLPGRTDCEIKNFCNTNFANREEAKPNSNICQIAENDNSEAGQPQKYEDSLCNDKVLVTSDQAKPRIEDTEEQSSLLASAEGSLSDFLMNFDFETTMFSEFLDSEFLQTTDFEMFDMNNSTQQQGNSGDSLLLSIDKAAGEENGNATKQSCEGGSGSDFLQNSLHSELGSWDAFLDSAEEYAIWD